MLLIERVYKNEFIYFFSFFQISGYIMSKENKTQSMFGAILNTSLNAITQNLIDSEREMH